MLPHIGGGAGARCWRCRRSTAATRRSCCADAHAANVAARGHVRAGQRKRCLCLLRHGSGEHGGGAQCTLSQPHWTSAKTCPLPRLAVPTRRPTSSHVSPSSTRDTWSSAAVSLTLGCAPWQPKCRTICTHATRATIGPALHFPAPRAQHTTYVKVWVSPGRGHPVRVGRCDVDVPARVVRRERTPLGIALPDAMHPRDGGRNGFRDRTAYHVA